MMVQKYNQTYATYTPGIIKVEIYKPTREIIDISDYFTARLGDNQTPLLLQFVKKGVNVSNTQGFYPIAEGRTGVPDGNYELNDANSIATTYRGSTTDINENGVVTLRLPDGFFPQTGIWKGHFGLQNDTNGRKYTTADVVFEVNGDTANAYIDCAPYRSDWEAFMQEFKQESREALDAIKADYNSSMTVINDSIKNLNQAAGNLQGQFNAMDVVSHKDFNSLSEELQAQVKAAAESAGTMQVSGTYADATALKAALPAGGNGFYVTSDTNHMWFWDHTSNSWVDIGGVGFGEQEKSDAYAYMLEQTNLIPDGKLLKKDASVLSHNEGTTLTTAAYDNMNWIRVTGQKVNGNTDVYWKNSTGDLSWLFWSGWKFSLDIRTLVKQTFTIRLDIIDNSNSLHQIIVREGINPTNMEHQKLSVEIPRVSSIYKTGNGIKQFRVVISASEETLNYDVGNLSFTRNSAFTINGADYDQELLESGSFDNYVNKDFKNGNGTNLSIKHFNNKNWLNVDYSGVEGGNRDIYALGLLSDPRMENAVNEPFRISFTAYAKKSTVLLLSYSFWYQGVSYSANIDTIQIPANREVRVDCETGIMSQLLDLPNVADLSTAAIHYVITGTTDTYAITDASIKRSVTKPDSNDNIAPNINYLQGKSINHGPGLKTIYPFIDNERWVGVLPDLTNTDANTDTYLTLDIANDQRLTGFIYGVWKFSFNLISDTNSKYRIHLQMTVDDELVDVPMVVFKARAKTHQTVECSTPILNNFYVNSTSSIRDVKIVISTDEPRETLNYNLSKMVIKRGDRPVDYDSVASEFNDGIMSLNIIGDSPTSADETTINKFELIDGTRSVKGYTKSEWQGQSSLDLAKKSYNFKPYADSSMSSKMHLQIAPSMPADTKFVLKAFYSEKTLSLDTIANQLAHDLAVSRKTYDKNLAESSFFGQYAGRPVNLYWNGEYAGLYFMRSGSKDKAFHIDEDNPDQFVVEGLGESGASMFQADHVTKWNDGGNGINMEFEANIPDQLTDAQKTAFDNFVNFVNTSDNETFKSKISDISKEAAIDYIIFYNLMANVDSCGRNLEYATWDGGKNFTVIPYDFDQTLFNNWDGSNTDRLSDDGFPVKQMRFGSTSNKYFDQIAEAFPDELYSRYQEVRSSIFNSARVVKLYTDYWNSIGQKNYDRELSRWPRSVAIDQKYITKFIYQRFALVDQQFKEHLNK